LMNTETRTDQYLRLNRKYLEEGEELFKKGDYAQASEKFWGAAAEAIKAVAADRGVSLGTHRSLGEFVVELNRERPEWGLVEGFHIANSLHTNFYDDWLPPEMVETGAQRVRDLIEKLRSLCEGN